ncbi:hypothetical protein D3C86_1707160 [compost metagenome]
MSLDDLDVDLVTEYPRRGVQQLQAQVDAHAEVGGKHYGDLPTGIGQQLFFLDTEAGRTNHHGLAGLPANFQVFQGHRRVGEIDQHIEPIQHFTQTA